MIIITGSQSFIAKKLIKRLEKEKIKFVGLDKKNKKISKKHIKEDINSKNLNKYIKKKFYHHSSCRYIKC